MIVRSLLFFLVLFVSYNAYLVMGDPPVNFFQNQWQKNVKQAQEFIYNSNAKKVIVGSSMAERMGVYSFPNDYYNLSFSGGSALTGLEIIKRSNTIPINIYIEVNTIFKYKDEEMIDSLFYPVWWRIKKIIPAFQEKNQPLNVFLSPLKNRFNRSHEQRLTEKRNEKIFDAQIKRRVELDAQGIKGYENELISLKKLTEYFESMGARVYFFEMPIAIELANLKRSQQQRKIIKQNFSSTWLEFPDSHQYETTDGVHLTYKSAYDFGRLFVDYTMNIKSFK